MNPSSSLGSFESQSPADDLMDDWLFLSPASTQPQHLEVSRENHEADDRSKLKSKLVSAWNSVKYGLLQFPSILTVVHCYCVMRSDVIVLFFVLGNETLCFYLCFRLVLEAEIQIWKELSGDHAGPIL